jgi:multicomponent Na+:H+ antiporter subunit C
VIDLFLDRYVYLLVLALLAIGLYGMLAMGNLAKKLIGMVIFTTAIYLFFIHGSLQEGASAPIIVDELGNDPTAYVDPLPHLLILTAIVVGVGVLGVGLALLVRIYRAHGTFDEAVVADRLSGRAEAVGAPTPGRADGGADGSRLAPGSSGAGDPAGDRAEGDGPDGDGPDGDGPEDGRHGRGG